MRPAVNTGPNNELRGESQKHHDKHTVPFYRNCRSLQNLKSIQVIHFLEIAWVGE